MFGIDPGFMKHLAVNKVNRASLKGGYLHTGGSATIPKNRERMTRSLDRPPTEPELFRETHARKHDNSVVEKHADDLLFSANFEQATQHAQEEGDETPGTVDPNVVWRQTLSEPYRNQVYGVSGFFATSLRTSSYGGLSASATSTHTGLNASEVVDLREQGQVLQQHIVEVRSLKDILAERDARAEEHLQCIKEMQQHMVAFYNPLHPGSSTTVGGSGSSTAPPLPPRSPPQQTMMTTTRMRS
ncbi:hypothetical protein PIB30_060843 [Stylosanthes scabra]|uniref:Uncharacterized protein n=1 Tax=Stylosanthes scabra TaxID=79078 RepID=A0ABU6UMB8_9FABA|nr:hypothetical protein [Stylosanthes scabra]